jgi:hypothetical protein
MDAELARMWTDLVGRLTGPLTLRLYLQPTMATLFALRDGLKDARTGRPRTSGPSSRIPGSAAI